MLLQIRFHRNALSLEEAIRSAMANVRKAGFDIARVEIEPDVVAQKAQVTDSAWTPQEKFVSDSD